MLLPGLWTNPAFDTGCFLVTVVVIVVVVVVGTVVCRVGGGRGGEELTTLFGSLAAGTDFGFRNAFSKLFATTVVFCC